MAAVEGAFKESLSQALRGLNLENVFLCLEKKEAIRRNVVLKKTL